MMSTRRQTFTSHDLPPIGTVYAMRLDESQFGACRVLAVRTPEMHRETGKRDFIAFVVPLLWTGNHIPSLEEVSASPILRRRESAAVTELRGEAPGSAPKPWGIWVGEPAPSDFTNIGIASSRPLPDARP